MTERWQFPDVTREAADELPGFPDPDVPGTEQGTFPELVRDCRRMARKWAAPHSAAHAPVAPSSIHGTKVPQASSDVVARMPEYGS
jgi:hypothetical protein